MNEYLHAIKIKWRNSAFARTFNLTDEKAKGRSCFLASSILSSLAAQLSGGVFYTGFLLSFGINIVNIGIITFVPTITRLLSMFSPLILERFRSRKVFLTVMGILANIINILGVTLLPDIITSETGRVIGFTLLVTISSAISAIIDPGYSAWHAPYLPNEIRGDYFTLSSGVNSFVTQGVVLILSLVADSFAGSPRQLEIITGFRYAALVLAIMHILVLAIPKEYPYEQSDSKIKLSNIFILPFKSKKFLWTVLLIGFYYLGASLTNASINIFLLQDVGVTYSQINLINAVYFMFFIFFGKMWKKVLKKYSWFKTLAIAMLLQGPTFIMYAFVTAENYTWLWFTVRLLQHVLGVVSNTVIASMLYVNLPDTDRTYYVSFYNIVIHMSSFLSMMLGTMFLSWMGDNVLNVFGFKMAGVPVLLAITGIAEVIVGILSWKFNDKLLPDDLSKR
ncbi:MAG TPA: MFS transporter [Clostridia bacterium]|jgi:MFS family permease|nr:MFS transporter [Clostridiaceae bacterium]HOF26800.1 MFS transporter [Clostridia bacterium]HOM33865.1 MFS transporter [Clostridia bacterium]HOR89877.1 MFS transporter [Clostridia bacterium]HOT69939.1 MFS transporter [Clostridia bacterium]